MKEVKTPKKPLAYYYGIVLIVLIVFNLVVTPILMEHQVKEGRFLLDMRTFSEEGIEYLATQIRHVMERKHS